MNAVTGELSEQRRFFLPDRKLTDFPESRDAMSQVLGKQQRKRSYSCLTQDTDEAHFPLKRVNKVPDTSPKQCLLNGLHSLLNEDIQMFGDYQTVDRLLQAQSDFKQKKIPCHVDVAYHHTRSENLKTIETNGLLSRYERARDLPGVAAVENGIVYGDGIYCSDYPLSNFDPKFGDTTIILVRMKGKVGRHRSQKALCNSLIPSRDICVLQSCNQCFPLVHFPFECVTGDFLDILSKFQENLQKLLDTLFNGGTSTPVKSDWKTRFRWRDRILKVKMCRSKHFSSDFPTKRTSAALSYLADEHRISPIERFGINHRPSLTSTMLKQGCQICSKSLFRGGKVVQIQCNGHCVHKACLLSRMPSGRMIVLRDPSPCAGFEQKDGIDIGTIVICYDFDCSCQRDYHPNPGVLVASTIHTAYLPDTVEGRDLLKRLLYAFSTGCTFQVGTSPITGQPNSIVWASIPHKTNRQKAGPNGYPDPCYFNECNRALDRLAVPPAESLACPI